MNKTLATVTEPLTAEREHTLHFTCMSWGDMDVCVQAQYEYLYVANALYVHTVQLRLCNWMDWKAETLQNPL